jgi:two-component system sensor histidine kinase HupT/HoxJ
MKVNEGQTVRLTIEDTGLGIPPDVLPRIFDPFFTTKDVGKGTGLGLAITYGIIQEHGGTIHATNLPGGGARFTIELPAVE